VSFHRGSGAADVQLEPLSATIIPYFFNAVRITCTDGANMLMLTEFLQPHAAPHRCRMRAEVAAA